MVIAILQLFVTAAACFGLWRFVRRFDRPDLTSRLIVVGFLVRAVGAELLFWISWLRLPIGRSLQIGNGLWFFAMDGAGYLSYATGLLAKGAKAILTIDASYPSHVFVQWLTLCTAAFGVVASAGILLNCAAYLATCALILRIAPPAAVRARAFAVGAVALGPTCVLWSLQPLKDTVFLLLITVAIALGHEWQILWRNAPRAGRAVLCAAAMCATIYAIAGTRWYVGAITALGLLVFLPLVANLPRPRLAPSLAAAVLVLLLGTAFLIGGDGDIPPALRQALTPSMLTKRHVETAGELLVATRKGFRTTGGGTAISPGAALVPANAPAIAPKATKPAATKTAHVAATPHVRPPSPAAGTPAPAPQPAAAAAVTTAPPPVTTASAAQPPTAPAIVATPVSRGTSAPIATETTAPAPAVKSPAATPTPIANARTPPPAPPVAAPPPAQIEKRAAEPVVTVTSGTSATPAPETTTAPAPRVAAAPIHVQEPTTHHATRREEPAAAARLEPPAVVVPQPIPHRPAPPPQPKPRPEPSLGADIATGVAAMFLPRAIAQRAGLVQIGGGRGFWLFADADTLVFDFVILFAFGYSLQRLVRKQRRATPLFILVVVMFVALCGPMTYTVTNFGTLFRLREMLYMLAALLPITLALPERAH